MPDDLEQLQRKIEEGLAAVRELKRMKAQQQRKERPKLKLLKGGMVWGAVVIGVEWLRDYRRTVAMLAVSGLTVGGVVIAEQPHSPGSDPPQTAKPPVSVKPTMTPKPTPEPTLRPPRTSPRRTMGRSSTPVAASTSTRPTPRPTPAPTRTRITKKPSKAPTETPTVSLTKTLLPTTLVKTPSLVSPATTCVVDLLGVELCLPLGSS